MINRAIKIIDEFSGAGGGENCDLIIHGDEYAVVFDGASALGMSELAPAEFVRRFAALFSDRFKQTHELCDAINFAASNVGGGAGALSPSAAAVFVAVCGGELRIAAFGDCTALLIGDSGTERIHKTDVDEFDDKVLDRVKEIRARTGANVADIVSSDEITAMLIANRRKMNVSDGYRVLSAGMPPVTRDEIISRPLGGLKKVVLFSDGFDAVEDLLREGVPFNEAYAELRAAENADNAFNARPRFKKSDDASALSFEVIAL